jgi:hypothetical protein
MSAEIFMMWTAWSFFAGLLPEELTAYTKKSAGIVDNTMEIRIGYLPITSTVASMLETDKQLEG